MVGWFVRLLLMISGPIAGWFVSHEALNYPYIKMIVAIFLFTLFATVMAFWPKFAEWHFKCRKCSDKPDN